MGHFISAAVTRFGVGDTWQLPEVSCRINSLRNDSGERAGFYYRVKGFFGMLFLRALSKNRIV